MQTRKQSVVAGLLMYVGSGEHGEAVEIRKEGPEEWIMWIRDDDDREVQVTLDTALIYDLREWCTSVMVDEGHERYERLAVPT